MPGVKAPFEIVQHRLIPVNRGGYRAVPGQVKVSLRIFSHSFYRLSLMAQPLQRLRHGGRVFLDKKAVHAVLYVLGGAASRHQHAGQGAGGRLTHNQAVGVKA